MPDASERTFPAHLEKLAEVNEFSLASAVAAGVPDARLPLLELAIEELAVNIINHAYGGAGGALTVRCETGRGRFLLSFEDSGPAFNPLDLPDPDVTAPLEERPVGGLGVFLTKKAADDIRYERRGDRNVVTLEIGLADAPPASPGTS